MEDKTVSVNYDKKRNKTVLVIRKNGVELGRESARGELSGDKLKTVIREVTR